MRKSYGKYAVMADAMRNGSPGAGLCILTAIFLVVVLLGIAGFGGRGRTEQFLYRNVPLGMAVDHYIVTEARTGTSGPLRD